MNFLKSLLSNLFSFLLNENSSRYSLSVFFFILSLLIKTLNISFNYSVSVFMPVLGSNSFDFKTSIYNFSKSSKSTIFPPLGTNSLVINNLTSSSFRSFPALKTAFRNSFYSNLFFSFNSSTFRNSFKFSSLFFR